MRTEREFSRVPLMSSGAVSISGRQTSFRGRLHTDQSSFPVSPLGIDNHASAPFDDEQIRPQNLIGVAGRSSSRS
jgi:hypothetical protein